jgi:hypothetical protein
MKFFRSLTTVSTVLAVALLSGCGSSASQERVEKAYDLSVPTVHQEFKVTRDVDANHDIDIIEDGDKIIFEIFGSARHNDFFVNSDNNDNSGHQRTHGADYLIEDGRLFIYEGPGWSWNYVKRVDIQRHANSTTMTLDKSDFRNLSSNIKAIGMQYDSNWNNTRLTQTTELTVNNDVVQNVPASMSVNENDIHMYVSLSSESLDINMASGSNPRKNHGMIFMDTDQDNNTGLRRYGVGADYLVQDRLLFRYTGSGRNWSWELMGRFGQRGSDSFRAFINTNQLGNTSEIDFVAKYYDSSWNSFDSSSIHTVKADGFDAVKARLEAAFPNERNLIVDEHINGDIYRVSSFTEGSGRDNTGTYLINVETLELLSYIKLTNYEAILDTKIDRANSEVKFLVEVRPMGTHSISTFDLNSGVLKSEEDIASDLSIIE